MGITSSSLPIHSMLSSFQNIQKNVGKKSKEKKKNTANKMLVSVRYQKKIVTSFKIISISPTFLQTFGWPTPQNFALNIVPPFFIITWKL